MSTCGSRPDRNEVTTVPSVSKMTRNSASPGSVGVNTMRLPPVSLLSLVRLSPKREKSPSSLMPTPAPERVVMSGLVMSTRSTVPAVMVSRTPFGPPDGRTR